MSERTTYRVSARALTVQTHDAWSRRAIAATFSGWHLTVAANADAPPSLSVRMAPPPSVPAGLDVFDVAGGTCHTDDRRWYVRIDQSLVVVDDGAAVPVEIFVDRPSAVDSPHWMRLITYGLSAALRRRGRFELHSAALAHPVTGQGILIAGQSGTGKSTLTVHLASAGWPFLTDDVLLLGRDEERIAAWPLRRGFAVTATTARANQVLSGQAVLAYADEPGAKRLFEPHDVFDASAAICHPGTLVFPELTQAPASTVVRLSVRDTMERLLRLSPWACYDRSTAGAHLAALSTLAAQVKTVALLAGTDLLRPAAAVAAIEECAGA